MWQILFWLVLLMLGVVGANRRPRWLYFCVQLALVIEFSALMLELVTGLIAYAAPKEAAHEVHRWTAHFAIIVIWLAVPLQLGLAVAIFRRGSPLTAFVAGIATLFVFVSWLACSFTAYLQPPPEDNFSEETRGRFLVLHLVAMPTLLSICMAVSYWLNWLGRRSMLRRDSQVEVAMPESGNPYQSPGSL